MFPLSVTNMLISSSNRQKKKKKELVQSFTSWTFDSSIRVSRLKLML